jgi:hypothetical protein
VSRTYRKTRISCDYSGKMYYARRAWPEVGTPSTEETRKLYRKWRLIPPPLYISGEPWVVDMTYIVRCVHEHVFRNRSSYRQRINAIRITKQRDRKVVRAKLKVDLLDRVLDHYAED